MSWAVREGRVRIGRRSDLEVVVGDPTASAEHALLRLGRPCVLLHIFQREIGIARRLGEAALEIGHHVVADEIVVLQHAGDSFPVDVRREQFGQRRGNGFDQRLVADEIHIGLDSENRFGQGAFPRDHIVAVETEAVGENEPALDTAFLLAVAVVVHDAVQPLAPQFAIVATAHERGVLPWHGRLVAVAIQRPGLHLALIQLAAMKKLMKGVFVVVLRGADCAQLRLEFVGAQNLGHGPTSSLGFLARRFLSLASLKTVSPR